MAGGNSLCIVSQVEEESSPNITTIYLLNLRKKTCTCGSFQENNIPCHHVLQCMHRILADSQLFLPYTLQVGTRRNTYGENWKPISLSEINTTIDSATICLTQSKQLAPAGPPQIEYIQCRHQKKKSLSLDFQIGQRTTAALGK